MTTQAQANQVSGDSPANPQTNLPRTAKGVGDTAIVRERIVREATRLFSARGYNGVSVREIVKAAGTPKPTLY